MKSESITWLATMLVIVGLLVGGLFTYAVFPREVTITKNVEVIKEVPVVTNVTVVKEVEKDYRTAAVALCLKEFLKDNDFDKYQEVSVIDSSKEYSVSFNEKKDKVTVLLDTINFRVLDTLTEERDNNQYSCEVVYKEDKDAKVSLNELE